MEIGQKSAIKYRCFDFIGKLYEDFKNLTNFNRTFFFTKDLQKRSCLKKHHLKDKSFILNDLSFVNNVSKKFTA